MDGERICVRPLCGKAFVPKKRGRYQRFCSQVCRVLEFQYVARRAAAELVQHHRREYEQIKARIEAARYRVR
jgi:endogenous inhibitor of DNA gyrase (YacG/DUF329 family)